MPSEGPIGDTVLTLTEVNVVEVMTVEWTIKDLSSLSKKINVHYDSPFFNFAEAEWCIRWYPNGEKHFEKDERKNSVYLCFGEESPSRSIKYTFGIKCSDGLLEKDEQADDFGGKYDMWGLDNFWSRAEILSQAHRFMPGNVLRITCRLKCSEGEPNATKVPNGRVWELSRSMKRVLTDGKWSDFTLKSGDRKWPVHRVILESRSEYFANLFRHDWIENTAGEVTFEDIDADALDKVLNFVYTGCVEGLSTYNVCDIYAVAHKFLLDDLKALCVEYIKVYMQIGMVCEVLIIAYTYEERDLLQMVLEIFMQEEDYIFKSKEWKELKKYHGSVAAEILEDIAKMRKK